MIRAQLLRFLAPKLPALGTRKVKLRSREDRLKYVLAGGFSKLAYVHAPKKGADLWTVRFKVDGYSFQVGLKNRMLAGFVARLIHAAADPEMFEKHGGVNRMCGIPAPETLYLAHESALFELRMPDGHDDESTTPNILVVDDWVATRIRGYAWFECNQRGMPDSWAVRPVVRVRRDRRSIELSWITIESVIFQRRLQKACVRMPPAASGYLWSGERYVDLRVGPRKSLGIEFKRYPGIAQSRRRRKKMIRGASQKEVGRKLPREGDVRIQYLESPGLIAVVEDPVTSGRKPRKRLVEFGGPDFFGK
jgi:hypothetical protein